MKLGDLYQVVQGMDGKLWLTPVVLSVSRTGTRTMIPIEEASVKKDDIQRRAYHELVN